MTNNTTAHHSKFRRPTKPSTSTARKCVLKVHKTIKKREKRGQSCAVPQQCWFVTTIMITISIAISQYPNIPIQTSITMSIHAWLPIKLQQCHRWVTSQRLLAKYFHPQISPKQNWHSLAIVFFSSILSKSETDAQAWHWVWLFQNVLLPVKSTGF